MKNEELNKLKNTVKIIQDSVFLMNDVSVLQAENNAELRKQLDAAISSLNDIENTLDDYHSNKIL